MRAELQQAGAQLDAERFRLRGLTDDENIVGAAVERARTLCHIAEQERDALIQSLTFAESKNLLLARTAVLVRCRVVEPIGLCLHVTRTEGVGSVIVHVHGVRFTIDGFCLSVIESMRINGAPPVADILQIPLGGLRGPPAGLSGGGLCVTQAEAQAQQMLDAAEVKSKLAREQQLAATEMVEKETTRRCALLFGTLSSLQPWARRVWRRALTLGRTGERSRRQARGGAGGGLTAGEPAAVTDGAKCEGARGADGGAQRTVAGGRAAAQNAGAHPADGAAQVRP